VLYTSIHREGALAEVAFHWSQLTPPPSKPIALHTISVKVDGILTLTEAQLLDLGVDQIAQITTNYDRTQAIGAAAAFLGHNGMIVPSVRWKSDNLILFANDQVLDRTLEKLSTESVEWQIWARDNGFLK